VNLSPTALRPEDIDINAYLLQCEDHDVPLLDIQLYNTVIFVLYKSTFFDF